MSATMMGLRRGSVILVVLLIGVAAVACGQHPGAPHQASCGSAPGAARFCTVRIPGPSNVSVMTSTSSVDVWAFDFGSQVGASRRRWAGSPDRSPQTVTAASGWRWIPARRPAGRPPHR
jgi:hypothetical protein